MEPDGAITILRAAARKALPWKNGGGVTREIATFPPGADLDSIGWRASLADVSDAGPFSTFAGIDRHLAVLEGRLELAVDDLYASVTLTPDSPPFAFPGDRPAYGIPLDGLVRNLNLMVRRARFQVEMSRIGPTRPGRLTSETSLIVAIAASEITIGGETLALDPLDAVLVADGAAKTLPVRSREACCLIGIDPLT